MRHEGIYKALSDKGNPGLATVAKIAGAIGLCITVAAAQT